MLPEATIQCTPQTTNVSSPPSKHQKTDLVIPCPVTRVSEFEICSKGTTIAYDEITL